MGEPEMRRRSRGVHVLAGGVLAAACFAGLPAFTSTTGSTTLAPRAVERGAAVSSALRPSAQVVDPSCEVRGFGSAAMGVLALGAAALALGSRDGSIVARWGKHDYKSKKGKQWRGLWGKVRVRPEVKAKIRAIRAGTWVAPHRIIPDRPYDLHNQLENPVFDWPPLMRESLEEILESSTEIARKNWKTKMGIAGPQYAFKDWTPPNDEEEAKTAAAALVGVKIPAGKVKELRERSGAGIMDCQKALRETELDMDKAMDWLKKKGMAKADKKAGNAATEGIVASYVHFNNKLAVIVEINSQTDFVAQNAIFKEFSQDVAMQIAANPSVVGVSVNDIPEDIVAKEKALEMEKEDLAGKPDEIKEKIVAGRLKKKYEEMSLLTQKWLKDEDKTVEEVLKEKIATIGENMVIRRFTRLTLGEGLEKKDDDFAAGVEKELAKYRSSGDEKTEEAPKEPEAPKAEEKKEDKKEEKKDEGPTISAAQVKELRQRSGAGIMDSKKALKECGGDMDKSMDWLKKKGMAKADKKAGNVAVEGAIACYKHFNGKLAVICEVNSETDFVAQNAIFKDFVNDVAMQIAANPSVVGVSEDDIPASVVDKEKATEMEKEDLADKPEAVREKIVNGRLKKKFQEMALLPQKWLKDEDKTVETVLKETIAKLGENIIIRRFERLVLGEGLEKEEQDFAAGVEAELAKYRA